MTYPGGKNGAGVYQRIISLMPPHQTYIEPFLGGGAIMRLKRPAEKNIGLDLDLQAVSSFQASPAAQYSSVICGDGIRFLEEQGRWCEKDTLIYMDPPYLMETRRSGPIYRHEMTTEQHERLLWVALGLRCQVMISGYFSALYDRMLKGWARTSFQAMTRGGTLATEYLWCNFPIPPPRLHDYRYLGRDFRERERIKRKKLRWQNRLAKMGTLERYALLEALAESERGTTSPESAMVDRSAPPVDLASSAVAGAARWS